MLVKNVGSIEEHEYFGEVLLGIKHVIQNHLREVQVKFQDRFLSLELDVRQRDEVITQLQHRIQELEENPSMKMNRVGSAATSLKSGSSDSIDIPFVVCLCPSKSKGDFSISNSHFSEVIPLIQYFYRHHHPNMIGLERK